MLRHVHLHGSLQKFGGPFRVDVDTPREAARALAMQIPGLLDEFLKGRFQVVRGDIDRGLDIGEEELDFRLGMALDVHFVPALAGAGGGRGKGAAKIIVGAALIAVTWGGAAAAMGPWAAGTSMWGATIPGTAGIFGGISFGQMALFGATMVLSGISTMLTPQPKTPDYSTREPPDQRPSFLFNNGTVNTTEQGHPVPLIYGTVRVGSTAVSAGIRTEQL